MKDMQDIIAHYETGVEQTRLHEGGSQIERIRTQELILRNLPDRKCSIADVGAGAGVYSFWLSALGHEVHFLDLSPGNVDYARKQNESGRAVLSSLQQGDARSLPYKDNSMDAVLLLGPMYHLIDADERALALRECNRVLKKNGILFTATISRFASMFDGFFSHLVADPAFIPIMNKDLETGVHENPTTTQNYFTTAYFHRPEEIAEELRANGFTSVQWHAVDGFGWLIPGIGAKLGNADYQALLLDMLRLTESEPSLAGISAHHLTIGYK